MKKTTQKLLKLKEKKNFKHLFSLINENKNKIAFELELENGETQFIYYESLIKNSKRTAYKLINIFKNIKDKFIGLHLDNCPEWLYLFWGILLSGNNPLLLDFRASKETLIHLLNESNAIGIITNEESIIKEDIFQLKKDDILKDLKDVPSDFDFQFGDKIALCTSGTTSTSKIFVYKEETILTNLYDVWEISEESLFLSQENSKHLAFVPFYHIFGLFTLVLWSTLFGDTIVFLKDRSPLTFIETSQKHNINYIYGVPLLWNNIANKILFYIKTLPLSKRVLFYLLCNISLFLQYLSPYYGTLFVYKVIFKNLHKNLLGNSIKGIISAGAYLSPKTLKLLSALGLPILSAFGMTEAGVVSIDTGRSFRKRLKSCLGKFIPSIEAKIIPKDYIRNSSNIGELYLKGPTLHSFRLKDGQLVEPIRDKEGWFPTGDLAIIKNGELYLHGRCKDTIIKETGENIYPDELECYFENIDGIEEFCILGLQNSSKGEDIVLIIFINKNLINKDNISKILSEINNRNLKLPFYKRVNKVLLSLNPLPKTTSLKIQRQKLKILIEKKEWKYQELNNKGVNMAINNSENRNNLINNNKEEIKEESKEVKEKEIKKEIKKILANVLGCPEKEINDEDRFIENLGGDSLNALELISLIERKYNITLPDSVISKCSTLNEITKAVLKEINNTNNSNNRIPLAKKKQHRLPICKFEDSREYKLFMKQVERFGSLNPYFVVHDSIVKDTSKVGDKELINLGSYNYLGLSGHPVTVKAAKEAIEKYGTSASGSRLLTGEKSLYRELEKEIAEWKHTEDAIVLVSGHATNVTFIGNFCNKNDLIVYDILSHNSIEQGCKLSKSDTKAFPHNNYRVLDEILRKNRNYYEKVLIVIEGVYSMDGDIAPVPEFVKIKKKYGTFLMVDEAHSTCVLGENGGGVDEYFNLNPDDIDIKMGTLSKGLGSCGGYIASKKSLIEYLKYNLPGFVFSVGISPPVAAAALAGIRLIKKDNSLVKKLHENIEFFLEEAHKRNFNTCLAQKTAIIPILVGAEIDAFKLFRLLKERGIFVPPAIYPAVPRGKARLRFCITSEHKKDQLLYALDTLKELANLENIKLPSYDKYLISA